MMDSLSEHYFLKCELGINYCIGLGKQGDLYYIGANLQLVRLCDFKIIDFKISGDFLIA
jgi:hypothetical protein